VIFAAGKGRMILSKTRVLDDPSEVRKIDRSDMLSFCVEAPKHYAKAAKFAKTVSFNYSKPQTIIVSGMGGSAIGGELLKDWTRDKITVPVEVCREYSLPAYADKKTLVVVVSYSGETEESLSAFLDAVKRKCMVFCVSSGGALREFSEKLNVPHLLVPAGMAPRTTLPYLFIPLTVLLEKLGLVSDVSSEVSETVKMLKLVSEANSPEKPFRRNFSKTLASDICGTIPVAYGFGFYRAAAQRFKTQFNENSKIPAKWEFFSELDHNEIVGWEGANGLAEDFSAIFIRDDNEPDPIRQRIAATKELMLKESVKAFEVRSQGKSTLAKMSSAICIGDFASVYLAILRGVDPTPVRSISILKEKIRQTGVRDRVIHELRKISGR
jgi:glucose/mannose-6-phosphate isomerase